MGKRNRQFEEEESSVSCRVCDEDIPIEYYLDRGDLVTCEACGSEFVIKSCNPVVLFLLVEENDDEDDDLNDYYGDNYFDDDEFLGQHYD